MKVQVLLFDGFDELDAIAPFEVLQAAARLLPELHVELVVNGPPREVRAHYGLRVAVSEVLTAAAPPDLLLVPGGGWAARSAQGAWAEYHHGELPALIAKVYDAGATIAAVCTGAMLLAKAGILAGKAATTHQSAIAALRDDGVELVNARVVDEGRIITSGGVTSGLDLALWILDRFYGPQVALQIETSLEYQRRGTVWRRREAS